MKRANDLRQDKIGTLVLRLAIPAVLAQLVAILYSVVDRIFIGNIAEIGHLALAGVGVCGPFVSFLSSFGTLAGIGGSILIATAMGEGAVDKARHTLYNAVVCLTVLSLCLTALFYSFRGDIILLIGGSADTFQYADEYMQIYTIGTPFLLISIGLNLFINAQGFAMESMTASIIGTVTNILLDGLFIVVFQWGVAGAAYATVVAQIAAFSYGAWFILGDKITLKLSKSTLSISRMAQILKVGLAPFLIIASDSLILVIMNGVIQQYGGDQGDTFISASTIVQTYLLLVICPLNGISGGTMPIVSYNYGAKCEQRIFEAEKRILMTATLFLTAMFCGAFLCAEGFSSLFTQDGAVQEIAVWGIRAITTCIIALGPQFVFPDAFNGIGKLKTALALVMVRKGIYFILILLIPTQFDVKYIFYAQPIADICSSIITCMTYKFVFVKTVKEHCRPFGGLNGDLGIVPPPSFGSSEET